MHRIICICFVALTCIIAGSSCQKEVGFDTPTTQGSTTGIFKAKIDGVQYTADAGVSAAIILGVISINAYSKDKKIFSVALVDSVSGTYVLDQNSFQGIAFLDSTDADKNAFTTTNGTDTTQAGGKITILIDKVNKVISGNFTCKVYRSSDGRQKLITEGSFQVPYTNTIPAAKTTDTFRVKIDGVDWTGRSILTGASGGYISVTASELNLTKVVSFQLPQTVTAGTYDLDLAGNYFGLYLPDGINTFSADGGKITVVEHKVSARRIRASFNFKAVAFTGTGSHQFTDGYFSVGY